MNEMSSFPWLEHYNFHRRMVVSVRSPSAARLRWVHVLIDHSAHPYRVFARGRDFDFCAPDTIATPPAALPISVRSVIRALDRGDSRIEHGKQARCNRSHFSGILINLASAYA